MAKRYYWLKLKKDFFDSVRIRKLRSIAGGDTFTIIYLKLLLYTADTDGVVEYQGVEKTRGDELALALNEDSENVGLCLNYLSSVGLAEVIEDGLLFPEAIENVGSETASTQRWRDWKNRKEEQKVLESNTTPTQLQHFANVEREIEKEIETDTEKRESKRRVFVPPTVDEVRAYCQERLSTVDPEKFVDYYTSNGWMVGKSKMKDWKSTVRNWERRDQEQFREEKNQKRKGDWSFDDFR